MNTRQLAVIVEDNREREESAVNMKWTKAMPDVLCKKDCVIC